MTKFEKNLASAKDAVVILISSLIRLSLFVIRHYTTTFWKYS
jgi:hypothetical protein